MSSSSSSSSSAFNCPACLNCLAVDFGPGLISAKTGCVGTYYGTPDNLPGLISNVGTLVIANAPACTTYNFIGAQMTGTVRTNTNPPTFEITFVCGSPADKATYTKVNTNVCIVGTYALTSRTQPSYPYTWPPIVEIVSTVQYVPSTPPSSIAIDWDASIAEPGCVTTVVCPVNYNPNQEFAKPTFTDASFLSFRSNPGTVLVNDWRVGINWDCRGNLFFRFFPINPPPFGGAHWTGDASYVLLSGGNPNRMFPASGSVFRVNIPNMVPRLFSVGGTGITGDFTLTY